MPDAKSVDGAPKAPVIRKRVVKKAPAAVPEPTPEPPTAPVAESVFTPADPVVVPPALPEPMPAATTPVELPNHFDPQPYIERPRAERAPLERHAVERSPVERPHQDRPHSDHPHQERAAHQERAPQGERPNFERRPMERRPMDGPPQGERRDGPRPQGQGQQGPRAQQGPQQDRFNGDRRPQHAASQGERRFDDRRFDERRPPMREPMPAPVADGEARPRPIPATSRLDDLYRMPMPELFALAEKEGLHEHTGMSRAHCIVGIVRRQIERGVIVKGSGTLEVLPDGYGFLRSAAHNYLASPEDIYVSPSQIRRMSLRTGLLVEGPIRLPIENQDNFALMQIELVNGKHPDEGAGGTNFEDLTALHPSKRFSLETAPDELSMRIVDLVTPIGKGQRGLIVAPPRTGKTILLSKLANAIMKNHPEAYVFVLLVDERPEEVTEMQRLVQGANAEVVASTFDEPPEEHIHVSEIVLEKAKRMVECKRDVVILLDSITRLARAHNAEAPGGGKLLTGGLDSNAMQKPKKFFGAARNVEEGGSLTILATALIDTGSKMDDVIFEEFKGTGNSELHLDRRMVEKRIYPAIDVNASGTRKEELLLHPDELAKITILRRVLADMHPVEAMELLINRAKKTKSNAEFLMSMNLG